MNRKSRSHRSEFLISRSENSGQKNKKWRNRALNFLAKIGWMRHVPKVFQVSLVARIAVFLMGGFVIFALFSPYFTLKKVAILRENPQIDAQEIEQSLQDFFGKNLFLLSKSSIENHVLKKFPELDWVKISEIWPDALRLEVKMSPPALKLLNAETANFSVISEKGVILPQNFGAENLEVIKVLQFEKIISPRSAFLQREILDKIKNGKKILESDFGLKIDETRYLFAAREIHFVFDGAEIWVDAQIDLPSQLKKLEPAAEIIGLYSKKFAHIDLRIPQQVFWKER